jgi:hypothetical protein
MFELVAKIESDVCADIGVTDTSRRRSGAAGAEIRLF